MKDAQLSYNNLQGKEVHYAGTRKKSRTPWFCRQLTDFMYGLGQIT